MRTFFLTKPFIPLHLPLIPRRTVVGTTQIPFWEIYWGFNSTFLKLSGTFCLSFHICILLHSALSQHTYSPLKNEKSFPLNRWWAISQFVQVKKKPKKTKNSELKKDAENSKPEAIRLYLILLGRLPEHLQQGWQKGNRGFTDQRWG